MSPRARESSPGGCLAPLALVGVLLFAASMTTVIVSCAIWPGEAKLTAPLLCPDDMPDAFVVVDAHRVQPGETTYNFTLYCVGPRGEVRNVGWFTPMAVLTAAHGALILVVALALIVRAGRRRRRRSAGRALVPPPPTPVVAPPVDAPPPPSSP